MGGEGGEEGLKFISSFCVKLVRIMLETSSLLRKYTHICSFGKYTFYYQDPLNFADGSIFSQKIIIFWQKKVPLLKVIVWELLEIF